MNTLLVLSLKEKKINYFSLCYHQGTHGFPQKISANLVQPFGLTRSRHEVCAQGKEGFKIKIRDRGNQEKLRFQFIYVSEELYYKD